MTVQEIMRKHTVNGQLVRSPEFYADLEAASEETESLKKLVRRTRDALNKCKNRETIRDVARRLGVIS